MDASKVELTSKKLSNPLSPKKSAAKKAKRDIISFIKKSLPPIYGIRQEIVHLWDDNYRIKYWGKNEAGDTVIRTSIFATSTVSGGDIRLDFKNENEINWSLIGKEVNLPFHKGRGLNSNV
jgi:hypothetical protein